MFQGVVFLLKYCLVYLFLDTALGKHPEYFTQLTVLGGHPVTALPITCGTEVDVVVHQILCVTQAYSLPSTNNL